VQVSRAGEQATVTVDAQSDAGAYLNGLTVQANVVGPDGSAQNVTLQQVAPGRYEGTFDPTTEGAYLIRVVGSDPAQAAGADAPVAQTAGWVLSYSPEYQTLSADPNFLARLASLTGGFVMSEDLSAIFKHDLVAPARATRPVWPALLTLAAFLLPLDIGVRRLVVTRYDLQRGWGRLRGWLALRAPQSAPVPQQRAEQLSSLFKAKDRAGVGTTKGEEGQTPPPIMTKPAVEEKAEAPPKVVTGPPPAAPQQPGATSATLLAKKKARERSREKE
ncbi:MAG: filamin/ABP280 repeat domain-containing protein, partial [Anaerolineales bacterium]